MFSMIRNIYNKKTKGHTLMEWFTATGKLRKFFWTTRVVRCVHYGWHGTHLYDIQVLATHAPTWVHRNSSLLQWSVPLGQRGHMAMVFVYFAWNACCAVTTKLLVWYSNTKKKKDFSPRVAIFSLHTLASPSGRNVNYNEKLLTGKKTFELFLLSVQVSWICVLRVYYNKFL